ncbi:MAG: response regulator transcription factor [Bacteroidetes bacterium]|nr:response regulator transcription factor [Bacteroidota bacterium]
MEIVKKVILVDDHKIVREGVRAMLLGNKSFIVAADVSSGKEVFDVLENIKPDIIILDIGMPVMDGVEIAKILNNKFPDIKVLILSANAEEEYVISAIKAGAVGFLSKESSREEFIIALNSIARGEEYYGESISSIIYKSYVSILKGKNNVLTPNNELSEREMDVVKAFSDGLSFKEIADKLNISVRTVETHKNNILEKLSLRNTIDMVKYAIKKGFVKL